MNLIKKLIDRQERRQTSSLDNFQNSSLDGLQTSPAGANFADNFDRIELPKENQAETANTTAAKTTYADRHEVFQSPLDTTSDTFHGEEAETAIPNRGIHFPWLAVVFLLVGLLSEVVDAIFLQGTLNKINSDVDDALNLVISFIIGATCFASMAFIGYLRANRKKKSRKGEAYGYFTWLLAGIAIVAVRIWTNGGSALIFGDGSFDSTEFTRGVTLAALQFALYIGTGFLTRDSAEIVFDTDIWEYLKAKREYLSLQDELADRRQEIKDAISQLKAYPEYAARLVRSKQSVQNNVAQYNKAAKSLIEAKMATTVEPDLMTGMYEETKERLAKA